MLALLACTGCGSDDPPTPTPSPQPPVLPTLSVTVPAGGLVGGSADSTGTVSLSSAAPSGGAAITLTSSSAIVTVPTSVTIPGAASSATFTITTNQVPVDTPVTITASTNVASAAASMTLTVRSIPICGPFLAAQVAMPFSVYVDNGDARNHFSPSGFFGDIADLTLNMADRNPRTGSTAIRIEYTPRGPQRFAGIYFQCPENNWGTVQGAGLNLSRARQVQFWARASAPGRAEFKVGGIGRGTASFPDSFDATPTNPVVVEIGTDWRQYTIDLSGRDLTRVIGGFMFVTNTTQNPSGISVFLDDIVWQ
jgi:hypothetical protein